MKSIYTAIAATAMFAVSAVGAQTAVASPADDLKAFQNYFQERNKDIPLDDYVNGAYIYDEGARAQWEEIEEFPPYEAGIDAGEELWNEAFANGKGYKDCFGDDVSAIKGKYPMYDAEKDAVVTLEGSINACREANGEKPLKWKKGKMADLSAYIAYQARGQKIAVAAPEGDAAMKWYDRGKRHFYAKRGQLNLACADCHLYNAGNKVRADILSPALGHPSGFPVYRSKWGNLGTLQRRYGGCNKQVRAKPFKAQSAEYNALEYFQTYMSNGLEWNGPSARK